VLVSPLLEKEQQIVILRSSHGLNFEQIPEKQLASPCKANCEPLAVKRSEVTLRLVESFYELMVVIHVSCFPLPC